MTYTINNYRVRKLDDKYFVTTDHGSYSILSENEFKKLQQNNIDAKLKEKLLEREILLDKTNIDEAVRLLRNRNNFLFFGTSLHIIVITLRCNMNCVYCHATAKSMADKSFDMTKETAKKTVDFIFQSPNNNITIEFQGGEPFLNWDVLKYIVEYANKKNEKAKKNVLFTVVTNFSVMNEQKMNYLINNNVSVCTSLDGPKELHDHNRKYSGGSNYDAVIKWIKKFNKEYEKRNISNRRANAILTLTKKSLSYHKEIIDEYVKLGIFDVHLRFLNNLGLAKKAWPAISYTAKEYLAFWKKGVEYIKELQKKDVFVNERMVRLMTQKISTEFEPNYLELRSPCGAAIGQLAYQYNGDIYTCDEARTLTEDLFLLGNVHENNYKEVLTCDNACATSAASINDQYTCNSCAYKPYCGVCPVCNYSEQGSIIAKISETDRCKIYMKQFDWVVKENFIKEKLQ
ncbi:His-Xaa-Ser system radical SAM maturase HxsB [Candidatus Woesearchaeota archaeon]|nr:His-Xaa-Ser system radical SAM maturase HxsB [Candidatus Woesearchaeota archaeon]